MSVEFRYARAGEYPECSRFLHENWAENHIYCRSEELFEWTFQRPGFVESGNYSVVVGTDRDQFVGILGGIPFTFNTFGESRPGIWLANYVIRQDYRRGPTALKLLAMLRADPYWATVAFGVNPATAKIYEVLRGKVLPLIPRHVAVLPGQVDRLEQLLLTAHNDWPKEKASVLASVVELQEVCLPTAAASAVIPDSWDSVDWPIFAKQTVGAARDMDFLHWRYRDHPIFDYRFIVVSEGERTGIAVWRLETVHKVSDGGERERVVDVARLVEFLPASKKNARELLAHFWNQIGAAGAFGADFYTYHGPTRQLLTDLGFPEVSQDDGDAVPSRFQPLDSKGGGILSAWFVKGEVPACDHSDACPWYWTKADSDQDRPN